MGKGSLERVVWEMGRAEEFGPQKAKWVVLRVGREDKGRGGVGGGVRENGGGGRGRKRGGGGRESEDVGMIGGTRRRRGERK